MEHRSLLWSGHLAVLVLLAEGLWWLIGVNTGKLGYELGITLIAMTCLVVNHFRWMRLVKSMNDKTACEKVDLIIVAHYLIFIMVISMVNFNR
jgi:hypothetical protein